MKNDHNDLEFMGGAEEGDGKPSGQERLREVPSSALGAADDADPKTEGQRHPLAMLCRDFVHQVDEMRSAATIALPAIQTHLKAKITSCTNVFERYAEKEDSPEGESLCIALPDDTRERVKVKEAIHEFDRLRSTGMLKIVERSLFIGLFSEFDAFMGNLLTIIYKRQPSLLKSIKREVALTDLLQFDSLEAVKQDMLDKEIDSFRRDSYIEQFATLENKFSFKTLRKFSEWSEFVEISQRRNLMTHNGGVVTEQYLSVCKREGCNIPSSITVGAQLKIGPDYYFKACRVLSLVAFMLVFTLWRKVLPTDAKEANDAIQFLAFEVLLRKDWSLGARMGEFALSEEMRKDAADIDIRIRHINLAIAYKNIGRVADMKKCLESCDWSASIRDFKLAVEVLNENHQAAADLMRQIGKSGEVVRQDAYHEWPLFINFTDREEFKAAYREIYGHDFHAKRDDESNTVTVDARGENGSPLIMAQREHLDDFSISGKEEVAAKKTKRPRKKKTDGSSH